MNAARFLVSVIVASDENAADLRICHREAHNAACRTHLLKGDERESSLIIYRRIANHRERVALRNGVEPF